MKLMSSLLIFSGFLAIPNLSAASCQPMMEYIKPDGSIGVKVCDPSKHRCIPKPQIFVLDSLREKLKESQFVNEEGSLIPNDSLKITLDISDTYCGLRAGIKESTVHISLGDNHSVSCKLDRWMNLWDFPYIGTSKNDEGQYVNNYLNSDDRLVCDNGSEFVLGEIITRPVNKRMVRDDGNLEARATAVNAIIGKPVWLDFEGDSSRPTVLLRQSASSGSSSRRAVRFREASAVSNTVE